MPIGLQLYNLRRVFVKTNEDLEDPQAEMDKIDWESTVEDGLTYEENLDVFKEEYPQYCWKMPKKNEISSSDWQLKAVNVEKGYSIYNKKVKIKPHNVQAQNKTYGRIQATTDKEWIGLNVTILVKVPTS